MGYDELTVPRKTPGVLGMVETIGFEPTTPWLQTRCSTD